MSEPEQLLADCVKCFEGPGRAECGRCWQALCYGCYEDDAGICPACVTAIGGQVAPRFRGDRDL